jgi:agmatine deiminase
MDRVGTSAVSRATAQGFLVTCTADLPTLASSDAMKDPTTRANTTPRWPAEWEPQSAVLLAWPHAATNWRPYLDLARHTIACIVAAISRYERVVLVVQAGDRPEDALTAADAAMDQVEQLTVPCNDIWARDYGPLTVIEDSRAAMLDFTFNGWGGKYASALDNRVTGRLAAAGVFGDRPVRSVDMVLEGGSVDSDGQGSVLTTATCLTHPSRNPHLDRDGIETALRRHLGAARVLWLEHGYLAGDDTDSHVDMLARFAPNDTLLHVACDQPDDEHFAALAQMGEELRALRTRDGRPYRLLPLPWPAPKFDDEGRRLPASYANFLAINGAVLVPTYQDAKDAEAL